MNKPLVSILIITYNQKDYIHEAIRSAAEQDYENLEVVVADDCSVDGTADIVDNYSKIYPGRVIPVKGSVNLGLTGNSNRGLSRCRGKYIAYQGGDDILLQGKITRQVAWLEEKPERVICYHDMDVFDSNTGRTIYLQSDKYRFFSGGADTLILNGTYFGATTGMVRYPLGAGIVFEKEIPVASDWLFWIDIAEQQHGLIGYINGVFARYRRHDANISAIGNHGIHDNLKTLSIVEKKYPHYRDLCRKRRSLILLSAAFRELKFRRYYNFIKYSAQAMVNCRGNVFIPLKLRNKV